MALQKRAPLKLAIFAFALVLLAGCGLGRGPDGGSDGGGDSMIAATVNGRPIYREDVRAFAVLKGLIEDGQSIESNPQAFHMALEELIQIRLFALEAEARGLDREPAIRRQLDMARERVLANAIYEELAQYAADPVNVERLYRENMHRLGPGEEVHLRHIQFETREAAEAAKRRLSDGDNFEQLAFELSTARNTAPDGGDLGLAAISDLAAPVREAVERTTVGQVFGPIQLETTWHLFLLVDRRPIRGPSVEELRPQISTWLAYQRTMELDESLRRDARIEMFVEQSEDEGMAPAGEVTEPGDATTTAPQRPPAQLPAVDPDAPPFPFPTGPGGGTSAPTQRAPQQAPAQQSPSAAAQPPATAATGSGSAGPTE